MLFPQAKSKKTAQGFLFGFKRELGFTDELHVLHGVKGMRIETLDNGDHLRQLFSANHREDDFHTRAAPHGVDMGYVVSRVFQMIHEDLQTMFGAGREERALSKVFFAVRKRLPWLQINLATAFLAAAVVGLFESTIARVTALAVFLPVVAGQSGNTGSQALAVTMRGLALREIRVSHWFRMARKEAAVGLINGCVVAVTTSLVALIWMKSAGLAAVIGVAMVFSMVIAGFSGAVIPLVLKALGQDPAQSSSIILTTVTDIVGFFSFLGLAWMLIGFLRVG